VPSWNTIV